MQGLRFGTIELQVVERHGEQGHLVILHQPSGAIEMYTERRLGLDEAWVGLEPPFAHFDLAHLVQTDFRTASCVVDSHCVSAELAFDDIDGNEVALRVRSPVSRWPAPLFSPAPRHSNPHTLRFLQQDRFRMLPRRSSDVEVRSGTAVGEPEPFLIPSPRFAPYLGARGSTGVLIAGLAPAAASDEVPVLGPGCHDVDSGTSVIVAADGLVSARVDDGERWFDLRFDPLLPPEAVYRQPDVTLHGNFTVNSSLGTTAAGSWTIKTEPDGVGFSLHDIDQSWFPGLASPSRLALWAARRGRRSQERWRYDATLTPLAGSGGWMSTGSWSNQLC